MPVHSAQIRLSTGGDADVIDVTTRVQAVIDEAGVTEGLATAFVRGSTAAMTTMEFEPGGVADLRALLDRLIPAGGDYEHNRLNARHQLARPPARLADRLLRAAARPRRPAGAGDLAAARPDRLRRPPPGADGRGPTRLVTGPGNRPLIAVAGLGAVIVIAGILAIAGVFGGGDDTASAPGGDFGGKVDVQPPNLPAQPATERIVVGGNPDAIAAGSGYVWASDSFLGTLTRINPRGLAATPVQVAGFPTDVAAGEGAAWLALPDRGAIQRVAGSGQAGEPRHLRGFPFQVAAGEGAVWAMSQKSVEKVSPGSGAPDGPPTSTEGPAAAIAAGDGWIWVTRANREVVRISPDDGELSDSAADLPGVFNLTVGEGAVWALSSTSGTDPRAGTSQKLNRIDPAKGEVSGDPVGVRGAVDVAAGFDLVWVATNQGTVLRINPKTGTEVGDPIRVGRQPSSIAVGEGAVWVADAGDGSVTEIKP